LQKHVLLIENLPRNTQLKVPTTAIDNWEEEWGKERNRQEKDVMATQR